MSTFLYWKEEVYTPVIGFIGGCLSDTGMDKSRIGTFEASLTSWFNFADV